MRTRYQALLSKSCFQFPERLIQSWYPRSEFPEPFFEMAQMAEENVKEEGRKKERKGRRLL